MNKKEIGSEKTIEKANHIGLEVRFNELDFNKAFGRYKRLKETVDKFAYDYAEFGCLPPLDEITLLRIKNNKTEPFYEAIEATIREAASNQPVWKRRIMEQDIDKAKKDLGKLIGNFSLALRNFNNNELDLPVIDDFTLVITESFEENLKERYRTRIKTEEGSKWYEQFLTAKREFDLLISMGGYFEGHFDANNQDGLWFISVPE